MGASMAVDWPLLMLCVLGSIAGGLLLFHLTAGYYHLRYYVWGRERSDEWKCQPDRWLKPSLQREAAWLSSLNLAMAGTLTGLLIYAMTRGWQTPIYMDVGEWGWPYTLASAALFFLLHDASAYYVHRGLHHRPLFKRIHRYHHRYIATTPYVTTAVHPVEMLLLQGASFLPLLVLPVWGPAVGLVLAGSLVGNIMDHSGVKLKPALPGLGPSTFHDDHHAHFHVNFGQHLMWWDRLHGSLRRVDRRYGPERFGGGGEPQGSEARDRYVEY